MKMKRKFKHRKVTSYSYECFNRLLDALVKGGFKIECCDLTEYKPMIPDDDLFKFIKEKHPYELIPNVEVKTYKRKTEEYCTPVPLENFILKINEEAIKNISENDILKVKI